MPTSTRVRWRTAVASAAFPADLRVLRGTLLALVEVMLPDGTLSVGRDRMADATGLSPRTLNRHLAQAVTNGWLTHERRGQKHVYPLYQAAVPQRATNGPLSGVSAGHSRGR